MHHIGRAGRGGPGSDSLQPLLTILAEGNDVTGVADKAAGKHPLNGLAWMFGLLLTQPLPHSQNGGRLEKRTRPKARINSEQKAKAKREQASPGIN